MSSRKRKKRNDGLVMPDGKRKRRHSTDKAKREWYAHDRAMRFQKRFGFA